MDGLVRDHGAKSVWIVDGDFIGTDPTRVSDICTGILSEKLDLAFEIDARADDVEEGLFSSTGIFLPIHLSRLGSRTFPPLTNKGNFVCLVSWAA